MINKDNFKDLLIVLNFSENNGIYAKHFPQGDFYLKVDFKGQKIIYPSQLKVGGDYTTNFSSPENFVVFECVHRLLDKGYKPEHIELEPKWKLGHGASGGRADILITNHSNKPLLIIECKTAGREFDKAWKDTLLDGGQLFSYIEQEKNVEFVALYASDFDEKTKQLFNEQRIVSHKDNDNILEEDPKLKSFKNATNVKERYKVWKETYQLEFTEKGIFEENIQPYQIGKDKYTLDIDTKAIDASDKKGKYHQFRTILRKYNVSRRENAFEVLVNLFLCKIVDERENAQNLKFYWKGIAYDNYFELVDRLQELYKIGMEQFLHQEITYVSNKQIDDAFWAIKQKRNASKTEIKSIVKKLKFFNDNAFGLISVRNKDTFEKNAKVLLELIQMWQGLRLTTAEQNQFLGDMFEFFLDNGIKQSEGQFFTPVPICKFVVMSLPLDTKIKAKSEPLKAIDYACGSGHFLTEYATQIRPLVKNPTDYFKHIYGIEKEDRLAKVAKVSAFMYGQDQIHILDADALIGNPEIKDENFDVLVANPPFAVEDFLMTLAEEDREKYELMETVSDLGNRNIQCFFLERAKQLLAPNGVAGIIVPSSVLSNSDAMHIRTREILLKYFDFVSIVELGSGTFGKTGTNTVVLFLRRKTQRPEPAEHYWNRTQDFFDNWAEELKSGGGAYLDIDVVKRYCQHINIPFEDYQTVLLGKPSAELLKTEMFEDYRADFDGNTEIANLKKKKHFKDLAPADQQAELDKRFMDYARSIEMDKLYYFIMADANGGENPQKVLLVKSPSDGKEQKTFLGYEWSGAKGSEGIKYNGGETVYDINTLLFDPNNPQNPTKINYLIQQNYSHEKGTLPIPEDLKSFVTYANLTDLLDFSRKDFNKGFSLTPKKIALFESKWELVKIEEINSLLKRGKSTKYGNSQIQVIKSGQARGFQEFDFTEKYFTEEGFIIDERLLQKGDLLINSTGVGTAGRVTLFNLDGSFVADSHITIFRPNERIRSEYALQCFAYIGFKTIEQMAMGATGQIELTIPIIANIKIPLPPLPIQAEIVKACEAVDLEVKKAKIMIDKGRTEIEEKVLNNNFSKDKLGNIAKKISESIDPQVHTGEVNYIGLENIESNTSRLVGEIKTDYQTIKSNKTCFKKGDILYGKLRPNLNKVYLAKEDGICSTDILVFRFENENLAKFYAHYFPLKTFNDEVLEGVSGQQLPRTSWTNMQEIKIPVPPLEIQQTLVAEIEQIEKQISDNQEITHQSSAKKQAVMKAYL